MLCDMPKISDMLSMSRRAVSLPLALPLKSLTADAIFFPCFKRKYILLYFMNHCVKFLGEKIRNISARDDFMQQCRLYFQTNLAAFPAIGSDSLRERTITVRVARC